MAPVEHYGPWVAFGLETIRKSILRIRSLAGEATEVVETRPEGYREFDPEVIRVDREAEDLIVGEVKGSGMEAVILSEELGRMDVRPGKRSSLYPQAVYVISDPFDGSALYRRQIPAFWFTALSIYSMDGRPLCSVVEDVNCGEVDFADEQSAYTCRLVEGELVRFREVSPRDTADLDEAYVETYLMKPMFMYPGTERMASLLQACKFIVPNGGPAGWADVAKGRVDVYVAVQESCTEVFTGLPIATQAGAVVTDWAGNPVSFDPDINKAYAIVCSANRPLHDQVLRRLHKR